MVANTKMTASKVVLFAVQLAAEEKSWLLLYTPIGRTQAVSAISITNELGVAHP